MSALLEGLSCEKFRVLAHELQKRHARALQLLAAPFVIIHLIYDCNEELPHDWRNLGLIMNKM